MPHEADLVLQCCRLLRGFTHPQTYFGEQGLETVTQFSVEEFRMKVSCSSSQPGTFFGSSAPMQVNQLLALTLDAGDFFYG
jgi:hypothetical protein